VSLPVPPYPPLSLKENDYESEGRRFESCRARFQKPSVCRYFAISRNLWEAIVPPLHGGGQGSESLGSTLKVVACRENPSGNLDSKLCSLRYTSGLANEFQEWASR
jgi:hypothetical protein